MKFTAKEPLTMRKLTKKQFVTEISKGMADIENGNVCLIEEAEEEMHNRYGLWVAISQAGTR